MPEINDAELEKFINEEIFQKEKIKVESEDPSGTGNGTMYWVESVSVDCLLSAFKEVAAFSAKRAREKAIEECMERVDFAKTKRDPDDSSVFMCDLWTIGTILDDLKKLKS